MTKFGGNMFTYTKPTHKRVKTTLMHKDPVIGIHKRFIANKTPYNQSPLNRNENKMSGVSGMLKF